MKTLCYPLSLIVLMCAAHGSAQQIALVNAPVPAPAALRGEAPSAIERESSSLLEPGSSAIMPVPVRPAIDPRIRFAAQDWVLLGSVAALRFGDYKSTVKAVSDPANFREVELPQALVHNKPGFAAFETSTVVANYYAYRFFVRRDHRTLARLGQYVNIGCVAWTVGNNYYGLQKYWPRYNFTLDDKAGR